MLTEIVSAVRAVLSSFKFTWVRCRKTGALVLQRFADAIDGAFIGRAPAPRQPDAPYPVLELAAQAAPSIDETARLIKQAAADLVAGKDEIPGELPDRIVEWLSVMDKVMLCRLMCAAEAQIRDHLDGKRGGLQKVIACERKSIELYAQARHRKIRQRDEEFERELTGDPAPAIVW